MLLCFGGGQSGREGGMQFAELFPAHSVRRRFLWGRDVHRMKNSIAPISRRCSSIDETSAIPTSFTMTSTARWPRMKLRRAAGSSFFFLKHSIGLHFVAAALDWPTSLRLWMAGRRPCGAFSRVAADPLRRDWLVQRRPPARPPRHSPPGQLPCSVQRWRAPCGLLLARQRCLGCAACNDGARLCQSHWRSRSGAVPWHGLLPPARV